MWKVGNQTRPGEARVMARTTWLTTIGGTYSAALRRVSLLLQRAYARDSVQAGDYEPTIVVLKKAGLTAVDVGPSPFPCLWFMIAQPSLSAVSILRSSHLIAPRAADYFPRAKDSW